MERTCAALTTCSIGLVLATVFGDLLVSGVPITKLTVLERTHALVSRIFTGGLAQIAGLIATCCIACPDFGIWRLLLRTCRLVGSCSRLILHGGEHVRSEVDLALSHLVSPTFQRRGASVCSCLR